MHVKNDEKPDRVSLLYGQIVNNGARQTAQEAVDFYEALNELCAIARTSINTWTLDK